LIRTERDWPDAYATLTSDFTNERSNSARKGLALVLANSGP
jgi:hypothetical protein